MDIAMLEARLKHAEKQVRTASSLKGWEKTTERLLKAERELALAKGEETALALDWPIMWDIGAPLPHVLSSGLKTFLLYYARRDDPNWDGTYITIANPSASDGTPVVLVEFIGCEVFSFGGANDEVMHGHPLRGKGLGSYTAHTVANSRWLAEQQKINSVHDQYRPETWQNFKHYILLFHDEMFECIARDYMVEVFRGGLYQVLDIAYERFKDTFKVSQRNASENKGGMTHGLSFGH